MLTPISVAKTLAAREKLLLDVLPFYAGAIMAGDIFAQAASDLHVCLGESCNRDAVFNSLRSLAGLELTPARTDELAWRLAGNLHRLRRGVPVMPWREQTEKEWVPVEVVDVIREFRTYKATTPEQAARADSKGRVHRRGAVVTLLFQGGLPAGRKETQFWSMEYCHTLRSALGFDKFNKVRNTRHFSKRNAYLFLDIREIFGRRFQAYLDPEACRPGAIGFSDVSSTSASLKWSRDLHLLRQRIGFACPKDFSDDHDCFACHIGADQCRAACHRKTFVLDVCPSCGAEKYFDPARESDVCIDCYDQHK